MYKIQYYNCTRCSECVMHMRIYIHARVHARFSLYKIWCHGDSDAVEKMQFGSILDTLLVKLRSRKQIHPVFTSSPLSPEPNLGGHKPHLLTTSSHVTDTSHSYDIAINVRARNLQNSFSASVAMYCTVCLAAVVISKILHIWSVHAPVRAE